MLIVLFLSMLGLVLGFLGVLVIRSEQNAKFLDSIRKGDKAKQFSIRVMLYLWLLLSMGVFVFILGIH